MSDFRDWFDENLADEAQDIAEHGADAGWPHITYTAACCELYDQFEKEIWDAAADDAEDMGHENVAAMVATFGRSDMANDADQFKNLMLWYMVEKVAHERSEQDEEQEECETCYGLGTIDRKECVGLPGSFRSVKPCPDCEAPK